MKIKNPQIEEIHRIQYRGTKKNTLGNILIKLLKTDEKKILKVARKKQNKRNKNKKDR